MSSAVSDPEKLIDLSRGLVRMRPPNDGEKAYLPYMVNTRSLMRPTGIGDRTLFTMLVFLRL